MTMLYLDASALAKLYLDEDNTEQEQVIALLGESPDAACSSITYAEVGGILARLLHTGLISEDQYADKLARFNADWDSINVLDVVPQLNQWAVQVMKAQRGLRGVDALHLASALALRPSTEIKFLTFDARLQDAAQKLMPGVTA